MNNQRCKHVRPDGFNCGSYAFNLYKEGIDQGDLCDVHYWQNKAQRQPLTEREVELIDGMIEVQLHHAERCDQISNRAMAEKQKGWDMERVELLRKLKAAQGIGGKV